MLPVLETKLVACSIKQRWAGRCEHLTLPSSLMGTHCVLTFKFPSISPSMSLSLFPSLLLSCCEGRELDNWFEALQWHQHCVKLPPTPPTPQSLFLAVYSNIFCFSPLSILLLPIFLPLSTVLLQMTERMLELYISMHSIHPLSRQKHGIWATETMAA